MYRSFIVSEAINNEQRKNNIMPYNVKTFRNVKLEARWAKTRTGKPVIQTRNPASALTHQREVWWTVDATMWAAMKRVGVLEGFNQSTFLGDIFYL